MTDFCRDPGTPKSSVSEARLRLLELTPVGGPFSLVVDKATYLKHYRGVAGLGGNYGGLSRHTEIITSKKQL